MKHLALSLVAVFGFLTSGKSQDHLGNKKMMDDSNPRVIKLEQTKGAFTQETITLEEGSYIFEITNNNVGHQVGFVLAPKSDPEAHIKTAYVIKAVDNNSSGHTKATRLLKGEYVYFCPMNPTPQYTLIVK